MGYLQILVAAASMAMTYGGVIGADLLLDRVAPGMAAEQPVPPAAEAADEDER